MHYTTVPLINQTESDRIHHASRLYQAQPRVQFRLPGYSSKSLADRFLNPSFIPIFFHGFSGRFFGLPARTLAGGVVGGVMGSPGLGLRMGLECKLPEPSVNAAEPGPAPESELELETGPVERPPLPRVVIALRGKFERAV